MKESTVKIDTLLEPLLTAAGDEQADELLSQQSEYYQELRTFSFLARETDIGAV